MDLCPTCENELPGQFPFCPFCGAALSVPGPARRKLATLLFCDLSGSTAMGERVDPESVQELLRSYFREMRAAVERHGGTVEKFIGDAVVAAFGVAETHEDDAMRACRAALEMQARVVTLNEGLEGRFGTTIAVRIGVNTGEVVTGGALSNETFATGDAVNVAARLEQGAGPGEVLLGELTYRLVREAVRAEAVEPLHAKGKSEPVPAYRLLDADLLPRPPRTGTPFAGREDELRLLERELETVVSQQRCRLVTVVGEPGVGKSRLTAEFVSRVGGRARVVRGACLSYGEGITFWAVGEIVRELAGIQNDHSPAQAQALIEAHLEGVPKAAVVAANMAHVLGISEGLATAPETAWAIRQFLIAQARVQPLAVLVDDLHWAENALLDLLAGLPAAILDAPILVLCLARRELLENRPDWQVTSRLEPLGAEEVDTLLQGLLGEMPPAVRGRLARASAGNPLFAEELAAMLIDEGVLRIEGGVCRLRGNLDELALPAGLHALLSARLERLDPHARATLERGAVQGEVFHRRAVLELSAPESRPSVLTDLEDLTETDLVRSAEAAFADDAAFRFKHILVRDSAYQATAKRIRAVLHEQFADWLERVVGDRVTEYGEILGHHLEQSYRYRAELGPVDDETRALGERAAHRLAAAGLRAHGRGDLGAAANLLGRAAALFPLESHERVEVVLAVVEPLAALMRVVEAETLLDQAGRAAALLGDERLSARVTVEQAWLAVRGTGGEWSESQVLSEVEEAIAVFERLRDDVALARALEVVTIVHLYYGRLTEVAAASERGYRHAERAHNVKEQGKHRLGREAADDWGSTPFDRIEDLLEDDLAWARGTGSILVEACATVRLGVVRALRGNRVAGNELFARGMSACDELGARIWAYEALGCWIWALTDDPDVAEAKLRETYDVLAEAGKRGMLSTVASMLAECLYRQERYDEAEIMLAEAADIGAPDDVVTQVRVEAGRAKLLARRGDLDQAEAVAREGVALASEAEFVDLRADSLLALAEVLRLAGRNDDAAEATTQALALWDAKGNVVDAGRARALLPLDAGRST